MKVKISVPDSLREITLGQYQRFIKETKNEQTQDELAQKMMEIFCGLSIESVKKVKYADLNRIASGLDKLFKEEPPFVQRFKMNGIEYGFVPKLEDLSLGEYIDIDGNYDNWDNIHNAMAVLFRPIKQRIGEKYLIEDYKGYSKVNMKQMPLDVVLGSMVFFWNLRKALLKATLNFLERESKNLTSQEKEILLKSGDGMEVYTSWLKQMSEDLIPSLNWDYTNV